MWKKFLRISFQVGSMPSIEPNVGLEVMTLRSGVTCATDWASQVL